MKKILMGIVFCGCLLLTGCGKYDEKDAMKELTRKIEKTSSYYLEGSMEIINNEDTYTYDVTVSYKKGDFYKVTLNNTLNNHEQVILRNDDGVYVITPSLNKSFKFQSDWPYNNSQVYLLGSILDDLTNDEEKEFAKTESGYTLTSKVNYPNNQKLVKQLVIMDKGINIKEVQILDESNNIQIKMTFKKIDLKSEFTKDYFDLNQIIEETKEEDTDTTSTEKTEETATIEDIIYPMYLPSNTVLTNQETINTDKGQRLILTFDGDSPFMLIEETISHEEEHVIVPAFGELEQLADAIGVLSDNSINWYSNGIEYYVISDVITTAELLDIARSISVIPVADTK